MGNSKSTPITRPKDWERWRREGRPPMYEERTRWRSPGGRMHKDRRFVHEDEEEKQENPIPSIPGVYPGPDGVPDVEVRCGVAPPSFYGGFPAFGQPMWSDGMPGVPSGMPTGTLRTWSVPTRYGPGGGPFAGAPFATRPPYAEFPPRADLYDGFSPSNVQNGPFGGSPFASREDALREEIIDLLRQRLHEEERPSYGDGAWFPGPAFGRDSSPFSTGYREPFPGPIFSRDSSPFSSGSGHQGPPRRGRAPSPGFVFAEGDIPVQEPPVSGV